MLLDEALAHWRREGATRARKGLTGLLGSEPRLTEDADLVSLLKERDFQVTATSSEMAVELKKLAAPKEVAEREAELRQKGYAVRAATPDEVAVVARQFHPRRTGQVSQESWNFLARHFVPDALVVAELRRQIIACLTYLGWTVGSPGPWLGPCFVEEVHRRTGLEGVLLHHALLAARQVGKERVRLHCPEAQAAFYQHAGFAVIARFCHEATADLQ
jgi:GNAT superfamily N-acetyltransferase